VINTAKDVTVAQGKKLINKAGKKATPAWLTPESAAII
jgi:hypothetical protein